MILLWLPTALADFDTQIDHIAADDPSAALREGDRIHAAISGLAAHLEMGRPGRIPTTRELVVSRTPFVVVYRYVETRNRVEILRVLHGAQQWPPV